MASFRELIVKIGADTGGLEKGLNSAIGSLTGLSTTAVSVSAVGVAAIAALGVAAFSSGKMFEESSRTIAATTGATGDALEELEASAKDVFGSVDDSLADVSNTLADFSAQTGATGDTLEKLTAQTLDLKDLNVGFSGEVQNLTRVYGDWGIAIDDAAGANDYLFKVAQQTGAGVDDLAGKVVQFGAPLRQMGFDFEESAALMGKFQKEGVNTETVMAGMRVGLANLSEAGGDVPAAFQAAIESIENAGSTAEANAIAFDIFGKRAGADMAAAVREGRFSLDELMGTLDASGNTIASVAEESETLGEKISTMGNKAMVALEPLGTFLVDVLGSAMDDAAAAWDAWGVGLDMIAELADLAGVELWDFSEGAQSVGHSLRDFVIGYVTKSIEAILALSKTLNEFPVIGGSFDASIAVMEKGLDKLNGIVVASSEKIGPSNKPNSFAGGVAGAKKEVVDLAAAMAAAEADTEAYARKIEEATQGLEAARTEGIQQLADALESTAVPALKGFGIESAKTAAQAVDDLLTIGRDGVGPLVESLESQLPESARRTAEAFDSLESKTVHELEALYRSASENFDLIQESGEATPRQISEAWRNELEAQKELLEAQGQQLPAEQQATLDRLEAQLGDHKEKAVGIWGDMGNQVSTIFNDMGRNVADGLLELFSRGEFNDGLAAEQDALRASLGDREQAYDDFVASVESKFDDFNESLMEKQESQIDSLVEKLGEAQNKLAEFEEDRLKRIDEIRSKEKQSAADATQKLGIDVKQRERDLKQFEVDKREDFRQDRLTKDRKLEEDIARIRASGRDNAESEIARLKASHAAALREDEMELETSIERRKREFTDWVDDAETELKRKTAIEKREADEAVAAEKEAIDKRRGEYAQFTADTEADIEAVKAATVQALADEQEALKTAIAAKKGELTTFQTDTLAQIAELDGAYRTLWGDIGTLAKDTLTDVGGAITRMVTEKLVGELFKELGNLVTTILPGVGGAFAKVFGSGAGSAAAGGAADAAGAAAGAAGNAGSAAGSAASSAGGALGWIGAATGIVSAVSDIFGNFQFAAMNKSLDLIEKSMRYTDIALNGPAGVLNNQHEYEGRNEWQRHGELIGQWNDYRGQVWEVQNNLITASVNASGSITASQNSSAASINANLVALITAVNGLSALAQRPVELKVNEQVLGETVSNYIGAQV